MKVVLLAAGMGSRLRPITNTIPKCMVPINGRPLLDYWMEILGENEEVTKIIINTHYLPESVREYAFKSAYIGKIELVHEKILLGTAGTLQEVMPKIANDDVLVAHADNLTLFNFKDFHYYYRNRPSSCIATMMTFETDDPESCGIVNLDEQGVVQKFYEKVKNPPGRLANGAVFIFSAEALSIIEGLYKGGVKELSIDVLPKLVGRMNTYQNSIYHRDIGNPRSLSEAESEFPPIYQKFKNKAFLR